jgi:hypothetical protein
MGSKPKYTEETTSVEMTYNSLQFINSLEDRDQDVMMELLSMLPFPGKDNKDTFVFNIDNESFYMVHLYGETNSSLLITRIETVEDIDVYLDYINLKKTLKWI